MRDSEKWGSMLARVLCKPVLEVGMSNEANWYKRSMLLFFKDDVAGDWKLGWL